MDFTGLDLEKINQGGDIVPQEGNRVFRRKNRKRGVNKPLPAFQSKRRICNVLKQFPRSPLS